MTFVPKINDAAARNPVTAMNGFYLSRVWHCFGNYMHKVDLETVLRMLDASESNVIPVNTHRLGPNGSRNDLVIGFGDVTIDMLAEAKDLGGFIHMLNINHQITAEAAIRKTELAFELLGEPVIKIEVLNEDLKTSNDHALVLAVERLRIGAPDLALMPLISSNLAIAKALIEAGCPVLRVMGTPIGAGGGIADPDTFSQICSLGVPVVLDGGVGSVDHLAKAYALGAVGCLVNSMLFQTAEGPVSTLRDFVDGARTLHPRS